MQAATAGIWARYAQQWDLLGPPLRPSPEDVAAVLRQARGGRTLILGVTPELARAPWPAGTKLLAADRSLPMIRGVWPAPPGAGVVQADWRALPLASGSVDLACGDGCLTLFDFPGECREALAELHRVLAPGGRLVLRAFIRPEVRETPEQVAAELRAGRIAGFHAFKWRLAMSLPGRRAALPEILRTLRALVPDLAAIAAERGWSAPVVESIEAYRGSPAAWIFPTLAELRAVLAERFAEDACSAGSYELAGCFPTLALRAR